MKKIFFVLLLGLFFVGCGGGSDSSTNTSFSDSDFNSYIGSWEGTDKIYLTDDPDTYCVWQVYAIVNSDKTGYIKKMLIDHQNDEGYCVSGEGTFRIENISNNGFDAVITSSSVSTFNNTQIFHLDYDSQTKSLIYNSNFLIDGTYSAKDEMNLKKINTISDNSTDSDTDNQFYEDFSNGLINWTILNNDDIPGEIGVEDETLHILRTNASGNGGTVGISQDVDINVNENIEVSFDAKIVSRDVGDGCGWTCEEYPVNVELVVEGTDGKTYRLRFAVNYDGAEENKTRDDLIQVTKDIAKGVWVRNITFNVKQAFPEASKIIQVKVYGSGWDYESYVDNVKIFENN